MLIAFTISKVPVMRSLYLMIFLKSALIICIYGFAVFYSKVSLEFNLLVNQILSKAKLILTE